MLIPVRCWSCGKVIAHVYEQYKEAVETGADSDKALDDLGKGSYSDNREYGNYGK